MINILGKYRIEYIHGNGRENTTQTKVLISHDDYVNNKDSKELKKLQFFTDQSPIYHAISTGMIILSNGSTLSIGSIKVIITKI